MVFWKALSKHDIELIRLRLHSNWIFMRFSFNFLKFKIGFQSSWQFICKWNYISYTKYIFIIVFRKKKQAPHPNIEKKHLTCLTMHINRFYELQNTNVNKNNGGKRPNCAHVAMRKLAIIQYKKKTAMFETICIILWPFGRNYLKKNPMYLLLFVCTRYLKTHWGKIRKKVQY